MIAISINNNKTLVATFLFLLVFVYLSCIKPDFLYNKDGSLREFGIGYSTNTVLPLWVLSIILGLLSYLTVLFYVKFGLRLTI
jgi:amino acid permease